jgi:hypothetical protein
LQSYRLTPHEVAGDRLVGLFRLVPDETVWLVRRTAIGRRNELEEQAVRFRTLQDLFEHARNGSRTRAGNGAGLPWDGLKQRLLKIPTVRSLAVATRPVRKRRQRTT